MSKFTTLNQLTEYHAYTIFATMIFQENINSEAKSTDLLMF